MTGEMRPFSLEVVEAACDIVQQTGKAMETGEGVVAMLITSEVGIDVIRLLVWSLISAYVQEDGHGPIETADMLVASWKDQLT